MGHSAAMQPEPQPIIACTVSRDVQIFDLLIEDMETTMGERWGDLGFEDALAFMEQPDSETLQFLAVAMDAQDEADLSPIINVISAAKRRGIKVILITEDVSPASLHVLLREGGDEFVPYPLPEGELAQAIDRVLSAPAEDPVDPEMRNKLKATGDRSGVIIPVQGMAGGVGATTFACNLAWELATIDKKNPPRVVLIDFGMQYGSVSTYLDMPRREAVLEMMSDTESMDSDVFMQALLSFDDKLHVLTSPPDLIPMDLFTPEDIERVLDMARTNFDYVVIDMPVVTVEWSQTVLEAAHVYFALTELDMRCAQNVLRLKRALQSEELPFQKLRFILNRGPKFTDLNGKSRVKRMAESLGISIDVMLPDGGKQITQSNDHGAPLATMAAKNPLRKEIAKLAKSVHEINVSDDAVAKG
ncbi:pilus assembly protein CpaE [Marivivens niveibacter]|uniref:Pilus assembly protein CpaE n=1 Tax=Marivivens niveibacter TaxID=1930667 RepID=A0A251WWR5_9RHOB|nr:AAA family ATPase [Marivivens niveibacter]OUD08877.1 pilus assembly protein CpaE [Marivivens niveibacter]